MRRLWAGLAMAVALAGITAGSVVITQDEAPAAGEANLWVDTDGGGSCARSSSAVAWDDSTDCGSFDDAYQAASAGDQVAVRSGSYGQQVIGDRDDLATGSDDVTFCVDDNGGTVTINAGATNQWAITTDTHDLVISGAYCGDTGQQTNHIDIPTDGTTNGVTIDMDTDADGRTGAENRYVTVSNISMPNFFTNAWATTLQYSEIGPNPTALCSGGQDDLVKIWWISDTEADPDINDEINPNRNSNVKFNYIHGAKCNTGAHADGLQAQSQNLIVEGNRFSDCHQLYTQSVSNPVGTAINGWDDYTGNVLRNNMFEKISTPWPGQPGNWCDVQQVSGGPDMVIEYNTFEGFVNFVGGQEDGGDIFRGNIMLGGADCPTNDLCEYNVFTVAPGDGTNATVCTPKMDLTGGSWSNTDAWGADFHIDETDTCVQGAGSAANHPATDIDGDTRASTPDAGADEVN